ncbi:hypothetical protein ASE01_04720 [Nocardioides sp. Root190]|uniref:hypothetical protein n=1 Tax=Nocardioides sp. Root190 TaxID=1736488 RepID=UPI0006F5D2D9|nr:hypothetical protein [Nocardioides sp. Root190]KRB78564.1 hypothetical protein ASE01_04720 [Nocardioides sp. Root190]
MSGPTPDQPATPSSDPGESQLKVGGGKGLRIAIAVVGVLLLIGVVVAGVLVLTGGSDEEEPTKGATEETTSPSDAPTPSTPESSLEVPTVDPSDFPTSTDLPTMPDLPSSVTEFPTSFPSDGVPSEFPSDSAGWDAWFSDSIEEVQP